VIWQIAVKAVFLFIFNVLCFIFIYTLSVLYNDLADFVEMYPINEETVFFVSCLIYINVAKKKDMIFLKISEDTPFLM
jgi:hypothetical protein